MGDLPRFPFLYYKIPSFKNMITTLIFDYGGTLDTDARHWAHVLYEGYRHAGVPVSEAQFREAYVFGERALAKAPIVRSEDDFHTVLLKKVEQEFHFLSSEALWTADEAERAEKCRAVADYCNAYVERNLVVTRRVLAELQPRFRFVLVSNFYGNIEAVLRGFHLDAFFPTIIESAVVGVRKPDPAIYRLGVEAAGCPAEETLVVGDSFGKDMVPAKAVGCRAVWLRGEGWSKETVDEALPDAIITTLADLPAAIAALKG